MTSEQSPHNGNAAGPPEPLTQEGNGLSGRVKGSAARFDWRESFKHLLFAVVCGVAGGFGSILLCLFVDAMRSVFVRNTWLIRWPDCSSCSSTRCSASRWGRPPNR